MPQHLVQVLTPVLPTTTLQVTPSSLVLLWKSLAPPAMVLPALLPGLPWCFCPASPGTATLSQLLVPWGSYTVLQHSSSQHCCPSATSET